jgi:hypothetical protein
MKICSQKRVEGKGREPFLFSSMENKKRGQILK